MGQLLVMKHSQNDLETFTSHCNGISLHGKKDGIHSSSSSIGKSHCFRVAGYSGRQPKYYRNHLLSMDDGAYKERIAALLRVIQVSKILKVDNIPCQIEEGLFLGSLGAANNRSALKALNVTRILTVAHSLTPSHPNDFVYKIIEVPDREDVPLSQFFDECFAFIDEARASGGGVLVHCFAGRSRSVTIIIAYLMFKRGMNLSEASEYVRMKRPTMSPNSGFKSQLQKYEIYLQGKKDGGAHEEGKSGSSV